MSSHSSTGVPVPPSSLSRRERRQAVLAAVVLGGFVAAAAAAYFLMPVVEVRVTTAWRALVLALLAVGLLTGLFLHSLRRIRSTSRPEWVAGSLVVVLFVGFVLVFAYVYLSMQTRSPGQLPGLRTHLDSLYFTVTMIATVGFGDIAPAGQAARAVASVQMVFNLVFLGFLVRTAIDLGRQERQRRVSAWAEQGRGPDSAE